MILTNCVSSHLHCLIFIKYYKYTKFIYVHYLKISIINHYYSGGAARTSEGQQPRHLRCQLRRLQLCPKGSKVGRDVRNIVRCELSINALLVQLPELLLLHRLPLPLVPGAALPALRHALPHPDRHCVMTR